MPKEFVGNDKRISLQAKTKKVHPDKNWKFQNQFLNYFFLKIYVFWLVKKSMQQKEKLTIEKFKKKHFKKRKKSQHKKKARWFFLRDAIHKTCMQFFLLTLY